MMLSPCFSVHPLPHQTYPAVAVRSRSRVSHFPRRSVLRVGDIGHRPHSACVVRRQWNVIRHPLAVTHQDDAARKRRPAFDSDKLPTGHRRRFRRDDITALVAAKMIPSWIIPGVIRSRTGTTSANSTSVEPRRLRCTGTLLPCWLTTKSQVSSATARLATPFLLS